MFWPCETRTSTCRNFATISSGLYRFLVITVLLDVKDIPQVGPLQWGRISAVLQARLIDIGVVSDIDPPWIITIGSSFIGFFAGAYAAVKLGGLTLRKK